MDRVRLSKEELISRAKERLRSIKQRVPSLNTIECINYLDKPKKKQ